MRILIADVIRSFTQVVAYSPDADPLYKRLKSGNLKAGYPPLTTLIDGRISGWKMQNNQEGVGLFTDLKKFVEKDEAEPALTHYEGKVIPFLKKQHGAKI